jgi:hypothetical protein
MMISDGVMEYVFTAGILVSFIGLIVGTVLNRKSIAETLKSAGFRRQDLLIAILIVIAFIVIEIYLVKPTQLLFFDDAIYQAMALDLLHTGQAWMCNYGSPVQCFSGQVFHEPIGLSFNFAISFAILGVTRSAAYIAELALAAVSVFMTFFVSMVLLRDRKSSVFSALILGLTPLIMVWAMPTNSDIATLAYSLIAIFMLLVFIRKRNKLGLLNFLLSVTLLMYMKVDALIYMPIFVLMFLLLAENSFRKAFGRTYALLRKNVLDTKFLLILLVFIILIYPSISFAFSNYSSDGYGYQGSNVPLTCSSTVTYITAKSAIDLANFNANICSNLGFWINTFKSQDIIQPVYFTVLALLGIAAMVVTKRTRIAAAVLVWFIAIFLLYTAFYAGAVTFGVDWRFFIGLMAETAILGGFALEFLSEKIGSAISKLSKNRAHAQRVRSLAIYAVALIFIASLFYTVYAEAPLLSITPSQIQQAGDARFYENFVYNQSNSIPENCLVYTYDPTLFNINNRTATQLSNIYDSNFYSNASSRYSCSVVDYGYWCYTPDNLCTNLNSTFALKSITNATYENNGNKYSFYLVEGRK